MTRLTGTDGQTYRTQDELARGGEGVILSLEGHTDCLAKLYLPGQATGARAAKLSAMLSDPPRDEMWERFRHASITWPLALLEEDRRFVGYLMPRIHGGLSLLNAYNPRARDCLGLDWHAQHQVAKNLCTALHALHVKGYVMGDLNPRNILVTDRGLVTLVDTDSFQVRAGERLYRCPVGVPEYTPRELQGLRFDQVDRTPEHDRFGLGVLVFQLLMDGFHPFAGALRDPADSVPGKTDEWCIRHGVFPWRASRRFHKPPAARALETLDPTLATLFERCFIGGHVTPALRPAPKEWLAALDLAQQRLVRCAAGIHWRYPENADCHACRMPPRRATIRLPRDRPRMPPRPPPTPPAAQPAAPVPAGTPRAPGRAGRPALWPLPRSTRARTIEIGVPLVLGVLAVLLYALWSTQPAVQAASLLTQTRAALARGDEGGAERALQQATAAAPAPAAAFAHDWADLYRALARRAQAADETDKADLALVEAARWDGKARAARRLDLGTRPRRGGVGSLAEELVEVPGGSFLMGCSPGDQPCPNDEQPPRRVTTAPFLMTRYEVTQGQWKAVMGEAPAHFVRDDRPVEGVSWEDIQGFLGRLNAQDPDRPYRLPTEAEWEYAARADTPSPERSDQDPARAQARCAGCGSPWDGRKTAPVGSFTPNAFGLYDTVGNVAEWVQDCYHEDYIGAPTDGTEWRTPCVTTARVWRGGAWSDPPERLGYTRRSRGAPTLRDNSLGLRLARDLP